MKPRSWRSLERHSLSAEYPNITGRAWECFLENLKVHNIVRDRKIILYEGKVIDGWQLQRGCVELNIKPQYETLRLIGGMTAEEYVETANDLRRHETQEQAMRRAEERRERVAAARALGMSQRAIAEQEGISQKQVRRDLEEAGESGDSPEPAGGTVQGRDGKTYSANKQTNAEREPEIPERLKPYFDAVPQFEEVVRLADRVANIFQEIEKTPAYLKPLEGRKHHEYSTTFRTAARTIKDITPVCPCPDCGGENEPSPDNEWCRACAGRGYLTVEEANGPA